MTSSSAASTTDRDRIVPVCHVVKGEVVLGSETLLPGPNGLQLAIPRLSLDTLTWPRTEPGPAFSLRTAEVVDVLVAVGERLRADPDGVVEETLQRQAGVNPLDVELLARDYREHLPQMFERDRIEQMLAGEIGGAKILDEWSERSDGRGKTARVRAYPPRLIHVLAGNAPGVSALTVIRGALTRGVHLLKLPSNDLFTAPAILRTLAAVAPGHPITRSFTAVYWRGGDTTIESTLFRPQFFDKLVAWGGEAAIRSAKNYVGPGFELVAFDPKTSISMIGGEAFASDASLAEAAALGATDATIYNQSACTASRFHFVEGDVASVDRYCEALQRELGVERRLASACGARVPQELKEQIQVLRGMAPLYRVWGGYEGGGLVIRSLDPVDFYPDCRIVNVVPVESLDQAIGHVTIATQTVGVYPRDRKRVIRDRLAWAGVQRVVTLGRASGGMAGLSHDGFFPLHRFVRWVNDED